MRGIFALAAVTLLLFTSSGSHATDQYTVSGKAFDAFVAAQDTSLQRLLEQIVPDSLVWLITGPIDPASPCPEDAQWVFRSVRVICPDLKTVKPVLETLRASKLLKVRKTKEYLDKALGSSPSGLRGVMVRVQIGKVEKTFIVQTIQQTRWLVWARGSLLKRTDYEQRPGLKHYSVALSNYFHRLDARQFDFPAPRAVDFEVSDDNDPFSPAPLEVLDGAEALEALIDSNRTAKVEFAHDVEGFVPTSTLVEELVEKAPRVAYYNKAVAVFQRQLQGFTEKVGNWQRFQTLTRSRADSLVPGEYFFAVGFLGKIRYGQMPKSRDVVTNSAFLFPGEPVLSAGTFAVGGDPARILTVTTRSPEYFYSNLTPAIHDDVSGRSDYYFSALGHFLEALRRAGVSIQDMALCKF